MPWSRASISAAESVCSTGSASGRPALGAAAPRSEQLSRAGEGCTAAFRAVFVRSQLQQEAGVGVDCDAWRLLGWGRRFTVEVHGGQNDAASSPLAEPPPHLRHAASRLEAAVPGALPGVIEALPRAPPELRYVQEGAAARGAAGGSVARRAVRRCACGAVAVTNALQQPAAESGEAWPGEAGPCTDGLACNPAHVKIIRWALPTPGSMRAVQSLRHAAGQRQQTPPMPTLRPVVTCRRMAAQLVPACGARLTSSFWGPSRRGNTKQNTCGKPGVAQRSTAMVGGHSRTPTNY